jgi:hypothetical protein
LGLRRACKHARASWQQAAQRLATAERRTTGCLLLLTQVSTTHTQCRLAAPTNVSMAIRAIASQAGQHPAHKHSHPARSRTTHTPTASAQQLTDWHACRAWGRDCSAFTCMPQPPAQVLRADRATSSRRPLLRGSTRMRACYTQTHTLQWPPHPATPVLLLANKQPTAQTAQHSTAEQGTQQLRQHPRFPALDGVNNMSGRGYRYTKGTTMSHHQRTKSGSRDCFAVL